MVDDQPAKLLTYEAVLSGLGVECVRAHSGPEALETILKGGDFAVILLDVNMPGIDGFEVARLIREHPRLENTPIIFVTAVHGSDLDRLRGYEVGAIDYISVPVPPEILRSKVAILVELYQRRTELQEINRALAEGRAELVEHHSRAMKLHAAERAAIQAEHAAIFEHPSTVTAVLEAERDGQGIIRDWIYRSVNSCALNYLCRSREEIIGHRLSEIVPERAERAMDLFTRVVESGESRRYETSWCGTDFLVTVFRIGPDRLVSSGVDITERIRADQALRDSAQRLQDSEERLREIANNIDQIVWTGNELGQANWFNKRWYDYTGTTYEEIQCEGWKKVLDPEHLARVQQTMRDCVTRGAPWEDTFRVRGKDGTFRWFLSRAVPIRDGTGQVRRWFGTATDVTAFREMQDAQQAADRRKDEFLAMLAHELRNPVAPITSAADALARLLTDHRQRGLVDIVRRQSQSLSRLLDDLLHVARITQGRIQLRREAVAVDTCLALAVETAQPLIQEKGHQLVVTHAREPLYIDADRVRIAQCLANLLTNAAKYSEAGGAIRVHVCADGTHAAIEVADRGAGIAPELLPYIFDLFAQGQRPLDRSQGGLGVGLSVCRQLVEMHGGSVAAHSAGPGEGATFTLRLPLVAKTPEADSVVTGHSGAEPLRVLVVDDNEDAADSLAMLLTLEGHQVRTAYSAEFALAELPAFLPHVALLDIGLPGMTGYELAQQMRITSGAELRLIAVSGYGQPEDRARSHASGFDAHLVKPVLIDDLRPVLTAQ